MADLASDYQGGLPVSQLVRKYAVHRTTVLEHLEREGVTRRKSVRKLTDEQVQAAAEMYSNGASLLRVGQSFGVDAATVRREFDIAGVVVRPRKGWESRGSV